MKALRSDCSDADAGVWQCRGYAAASCSLLPCVNTYSGNVVNGSFKGTLLSHKVNSPTMLNLKKIGWLGRQSIRAAVDVPSLSNADREQMLKSNHTGFTDLQNNAIWMNFNLSAGTAMFEEDAPDQSAFEKGLLNQGKLFVLDDDFHRGLIKYFGFTFSGTLSWAADGQQQYVLGSGGRNGGLRTVHNYGNFTLERTQAIFDNISTSLTTHMRQSAGVAQALGIINATAPKEGVARVLTTCVHIRWERWSLPGTVAISTLVFCGSVLWTTLWSTGRLNYAVRSWKPSPLPMVFGDGPEYGVLAERIASASGSQHVNELNKLAKSIVVTLQKGENGVMSLQQPR